MYFDSLMFHKLKKLCACRIGDNREKFFLYNVNIVNQNPKNTANTTG
jgi:hypothetical protein